MEKARKGVRCDQDWVTFVLPQLARMESHVLKYTRACTRTHLKHLILHFEF
jgi:hypothetical protein